MKMAALKMIRRVENAIFNVLSRKWWNVKLMSDSKINVHDEAVQYPQKPKRPLSSFLRFAMKIKNDYAAAIGIQNQAEIMKAIGSEWNKLSEEEKQKYALESQKEMVQYKEKYKEFMNCLTEQQKEDLKWLKKKMRASVITDITPGEKKKLYEQLKKPRRPVTAFLKFANDSGWKGNKSSLIEIAGKWNNLSESEKNKYKLEYEKELDKHYNDLKNWELKMFKEGNINVIRIKTLKKLKCTTEPIE